MDGLSEEFEVCPVRCKCSFCPTCCLAQGLKLRERLIPIVSGWQSVFMITRTVDPTLFPDPEAAHRYVRGRRAISELVRALRNSGYLPGLHYFCAVEWQKQTGMAHYRLLVEAGFVPWELIRDIWNRNRAAHLGPPVGRRPGFGSIRFSQVEFRSGRHAACYATRYLLKHPEECFPARVLNYEGWIQLQLDVVDRSHDETAELAVKVFELSQSLREQWVAADYSAKRRILEILCLNCVLDGATLVVTMRKPFDLLAEGLCVLQSRGDWI